MRLKSTNLVNIKLKSKLQVFEDLDVDKTGVLRPAELFEACRNLGVELSIEDAINIVSEVS